MKTYDNLIRIYVLLFQKGNIFPIIILYYIYKLVNHKV